ncbi:S24 family peptidase [Ferrimonas marina]|uniref:DNA polymerase V n=1 Tax=Ferrimonas marina TaxID=299255 RepID=A0A1M5UL20_9GAMM|nr:S24 family peptidase [Ferrimonas marina]SHH63689.1 DNA polymerase V [Ferrimonas marina]
MAGIKGFASPARSYEGNQLSLDQLVIEKPHATIFCEASGDGMAGAGILNGSVLIIERGFRERHGDLVLAVVDGEHLVRRVDEMNQLLVAEPLPGDETGYPAVGLGRSGEVVIEGVVIGCLNRYR